MLVVEKFKHLAMRLGDPEQVLATIPTAREIRVRGKQVIVAPHDLDEVKVLNNMGIKAPSPILHYYGWPGRFTPYAHQKDTAAFLTMHQKALVLNAIGTAKTISSLWAADYLMDIGRVGKVLILSPLSTLERVWGDTIFMHLYHRSFTVLYGTAQRRLRLMDQDVDFYICNHDGFPIIAEKAMGMFDLVIIDEAAVYRNPTTKRFRQFSKWMEAQPDLRLWLLTGTPTPEAPTDAWALARLVNNPVVPRRYTAFRDMVMTKIGMWKYVPKSNAVDVVKEVLQPSIRYTREDCFDLPETVVQTRKVDLTKDQRTHYQQMLKHLITEIEQEGSTISAANEAAKLMKLTQIVCGVVYDDAGNHMELDATPRINLVRDVIAEAGEKVIVFAPLTGALNMLTRELGKHYDVAMIDGSVGAGKRNEIFRNFQDSDTPWVLVAHPGTMAHGLTLTRATTIIWYGPIHRNEIYVQANGRIERLGKTHASNVVHIASTSMEEQMYKRLESKQTMQGLLLDLIQQYNEG